MNSSPLLQDDPSFIGIFYSRCKIGQLNGNEVEDYAKKKPGVYFREVKEC